MKAVRIVVINLVVLAAAAFTIEGCVRVMHPSITPLGTDRDLMADGRFHDVPGPRPHASGRSNGALFTVSEAGFWNYGIQPDTSAWLLLGDSVTMGVGVDPDSTFAGRLVHRLDSVRILNPSLIGYSSHDYRIVLEAITEDHQRLRRVTVIWCLNDVYAGVPDAQDPDRTFRQLVGPLLGFVQRHVYTYQWLKASLFDRPRRYFEHDLRLYDDLHLDAAFEDLTLLARRCREYDIHCEIVLMPYEYQLRAWREEDVFIPQRRLRERLRDVGLPVFDAADYLLSDTTASSDLYLYGDGIHLSPTGHRLVADYLMSLSRRPQTSLQPEI